MIQLYDYFNHAEIPNIILCNPNQDELYYLSQYIYNDKITLKFNALSELEFEIPSTTDNGITQAEFYPYVQSKRLIFIQNIGYFIIYKTEEDTTGANPTKKVMCRSIEGELISKKISAFGGTYKFYDPLHVTDNLIDTILEYIPSWSIGTIDSSLQDKYRTYNVTDSTVYSFLMVDVEKAMQCVFSFDFINKTISAYAVANATTDTDIYLSFDNLIEKIKLDEISDEIVTALNVFGGNDLTIRAVNPLGGNLIYNFDYFKTTSWMTQDLIDAIDAWEAAIAVAQPTYASNLASLKTKNGELLDLTYNVTTGMNKLRTDLLALEALQQAAVIAVPPNPTTISDIADDISTKQGEIDAKQVEIDAKELEIDGINTTLQGIVTSLSFANNFTTQQIEDLSLFTYENTFTNEMIITTSTMTDVEKQDASQDLYDQGVVVLDKVSQPRYEFSVDSANFIALKEFQQFTNQLVLGAIVTLDKMGTLIETVLLEINMSFKNPTAFNLVFSNRLRLDNGAFQYSDILGQAVSTGTTVTTNSLAWDDWPTNYRDTVSAFITSSLDAATNNIVNSSNQEMVINAYGLRGRKLVSPGNYSPKEMWMTNNILAFTDDNWQTSNLAIGTIETDNGTFNGIISNNLVGKMIAGNSLVITNDDGMVTKTFTLDQNGAVMENGSFTLINDFSKIILNPDDGITVQKNSNIIPVEKQSTTTKIASSVTTTNFSMTISSNTARLLVLGIGTNGASVSSATLGAQSLTKLTSIARPTGNTAVSEIWYLINPTAGTNTVTVNFSGSAYVEVSASEFYNVDQTTPLKNTVSGQGNSTTPSLTVSEASSDDIIFNNLCHWSGTATTEVGQTAISQITSDGSWKLATGMRESPLDLTPSWTMSTTVDYAFCATVLVSNKNVSPSWQDVFYIDTSGNVVFSGNLSGATGNFTGTITASSGNIGRWVIDSDGIKDPSGNNSMYLFSDGSVNFQFAGLDLYRLTPSAGTGSFSYDGDVFEVSAATIAAFGITSNHVPDFQLWVDSLTMNGDAGVSGTFSGLTFVNGILVGT